MTQKQTAAAVSDMAAAVILYYAPDWRLFISSA